jgi:predicted enzyme related to lactoylglutathione lyase
MPRIVHFEIETKNPDKVAAFYRDVFGWEISKWDGPIDYWNVSTGAEGTPGINGGLYKPEPGQGLGTVNTLDVDDLDAFIAKVTANGGKIVVPKMTVPTVGWMAYAADVEGNVFGMMQMDPTAGADEGGA